MGHTPERWSIHPENESVIRIPLGAGRIAGAYMGTPDNAKQTLAEHDFCAGFKPEALEALRLEEVVSVLNRLETLSDNCVNAERYSAKDALDDLKSIWRELRPILSHFTPARSSTVEPAATCPECGTGVAFAKAGGCLLPDCPITTEEGEK